MGEHAMEWHLGEPLIGMHAPNPMMRPPEMLTMLEAPELQHTILYASY